MSKNNPSEAKLSPSITGGFPAIKSLNLQVFVMIAAIIVIMLFFTWTTDGAYLSARNVSNLLRQTAITGILAVGMVFVIISADGDRNLDSGIAPRGMEWMVGCLPQGSVVYRHPCGNAGFPRYSDWHHQRHHRIPHQRSNVSDWSELLV